MLSLFPLLFILPLFFWLLIYVKKVLDKAKIFFLLIGFLLLLLLAPPVSSPLLPPPLLQIAFAQIRAQEKAEQAASHMTAHLETEGEEHTPNPAPLTSPSYQVVPWVTNSVRRGTSSRVNRSARKVVYNYITLHNLKYVKNL